MSHRSPGNLRSPPDRFVGRQAERELVLGLLRGGDRLVVVHGLAGMGKSRLAAEVASRWEGTWWVERVGASVADAVAAVLGLRLDGPSPIERVGRGLEAQGAVLVVLDDVDHAGAAAVARLVELAPEARFLCTARGPLKLRGERKVPLGSMTTEDGVALLLDRSTRAHDPAEAAALVEDLDGMPLAIEIAAARTRAMPIRDLRARLDARLLVSHEADRPEHHRSLAAAIEASAALLSEATAQAARALGVFQGSFSFAAAEAVLGEEAADLVQELVDGSFLRLDPSGRLWMAGAVRAWASPLSPSAEQRHGAFYAALGSRSSLGALDVRGGHERWTALAAEVANLEVALERAVARGDGPVASGTALALAAVLRRRGPAGAALERLSRAAAIPSARGALQVTLAVTLREAGRWEEAVELLRERLATAAGPDEEAEALLHLGSTLLQGGHHAEAEEHYRRAYDWFQAVGDERKMGLVLAGRGLLHSERGATELAREEYRESLAIARKLGDRVCEGMVRSNLALMDRACGRLAEARAGFEEALVVQRELGNRRAEGRTLGMVGAIAGDAGDTALAREVLTEALRAHREVGDRWFEGVTTAILGQIEQVDGDLYLARERLEEARAIHREVGNRRSLGATIGNLGTVLQALGDEEGARRAWEEALEIARLHQDRPQTGAWLTCLARSEVSRAPRSARTRLDEAELLLREGGSRIELGLALTVRAELEALKGDAGSAAIALDEAEELGNRAGLTPRSELLLALERVRRMVGRTGPARVLKIEPDGSRFSLGQTVGELAQRHAIRRVLCALAEARRVTPGEPLDVDSLFAAGWPGERAARDAARERVYHAVGTLRRLGLGEALERIEGGWRLDPALPLEP